MMNFKLKTLNINGSKLTGIKIGALNGFYFFKQHFCIFKSSRNLQALQIICWCYLVFLFRMFCLKATTVLDIDKSFSEVLGYLRSDFITLLGETNSQ